MGVPKIIRKGTNTYEFVEKVKDNMYLYQEQNAGYTTTFCNHDLGLLKEQMPGTKNLDVYIRAM